MNTHSTTSPFTLVSRFDPQQQQFVDVAPAPIKAAPERAKVSAAATGKIKKPRKAKTATPNAKIDVQPSTRHPAPTITETDTLSDLTLEERQIVENYRKLANYETRKTIADIVDHFAQPRDKNADPLDVVRMVEAISESEIEQTEEAPREVVWGGMSYGRREELRFIPYAIQLLAVLMSDNLMCFDPTFGDDYSEGVTYAINRITEVLYRIDQQQTIIRPAALVGGHVG
jgi:hypothetical protein